MGKQLWWSDTHQNIHPQEGLTLMSPDQSQYLWTEKIEQFIYNYQ